MSSTQSLEESCKRQGPKKKGKGAKGEAISQHDCQHQSEVLLRQQQKQDIMRQAGITGHFDYDPGTCVSV